MSRNEEIKKAEIKYSNDTLFDGCDYIGQYAKQEAFIAGAKWADEHPNPEVISRIFNYALKHTNILLAGDVNEVDWQELIRITMEE